MTSRTTPKRNRPPQPAAHSPPITRAEFDQLMARLATIEKRGVRTESKLQRLMDHHGLDGHGKPLPSVPQET